MSYWLLNSIQDHRWSDPNEVIWLSLLLGRLGYIPTFWVKEQRLRGYASCPSSQKHCTERKKRCLFCFSLNHCLGDPERKRRVELILSKVIFLLQTPKQVLVLELFLFYGSPQFCIPQPGNDLSPHFLNQPLCSI